MNKSRSPVEITFIELKETLTHLQSSINSPKLMRRNFQQFINYSQKLTSHMRTEYSKKTGKKWEAKEFDKWSTITSLFKVLRTIEEHDEPIVLKINYIWHCENLGPKNDIKMDIGGYWEWNDPLAEFPFDALEFYASNPDNPAEQIKITPSSITYTYLIDNKQKNVIEHIKDIGFADIIQLSTECFTTLEAYYDYYNQQLQENT